jgi:hypothetical protein
MIRRLVLSVLLIGLVGPAMPAAAQHVITRIEVRGNVPASIVIPQTALLEGGSYSPQDLDVAVARIRRLPFVYDAHYNLDGTTLIFNVTGTTPFFFDLEFDAAKSEFDDNSIAFLGGGGRLFAGSGVVEATLTRVAGDAKGRAIGLEYAHYGIGNTRLFAIGSVEWTFADDDDGIDVDPTIGVLVGYPLTVRQTITALAARSGFEGESTLVGLPRPLERSSHEENYRLRWEYDTTEDPYFTRRGLLGGVSGTHSEFESLFEGGTIGAPPFVPPSIFSFRNDGTSNELSADAIHYWPIRERGTIFGRAEASFLHSDTDRQQSDGPVVATEADTQAVRATIGYAHNFFTFGPRNTARHRAEIAYTASRLSTETTLYDDSFDEKSVVLGYAYRRTWATVRIRLEYAFE